MGVTTSCIDLDLVPIQPFWLARDKEKKKETVIKYVDIKVMIVEHGYSQDSSVVCYLPYGSLGAQQGKDKGFYCCLVLPLLNESLFDGPNDRHPGFVMVPAMMILAEAKDALL